MTVGCDQRADQGLVDGVCVNGALLFPNPSARRLPITLGPLRCAVVKSLYKRTVWPKGPTVEWDGVVRPISDPDVRIQNRRYVTDPRRVCRARAEWSAIPTRVGDGSVALGRAFRAAVR